MRSVHMHLVRILMAKLTADVNIIPKPIRTSTNYLNNHLLCFTHR